MLSFLNGKKDALEQMLELRPLPLGMAEFDEWSDRIIAASMLGATPESLKFALAEMIMHLKPTEDHCTDAYFIKALRKGAANQIAYAKMEELRNAAKERLSKQKDADDKVLAEPQVQTA